MRKLINTIRALMVLLLLAAPLPGMADPYTDNAALDELFAQLRIASSKAEADGISQQIWGYWFAPSDPDLDRRMDASSNALAAGDMVSALDVLDAVVADYPDYAEGWNQRATLYYMVGRLDESLADIEKVLAIEPRHFGALAGRVLIYLQQDKRAEALQQMIAALAIHPYLGERGLFPELAQNVTHV